MDWCEYNNNRDDGGEGDGEPAKSAKEHPGVAAEARGEGSLPFLRVVVFVLASKLLLLYSAQFGIYVMPQLDTLHSTPSLTQSGTDCSSSATTSIKTLNSSSK